MSASATQPREPSQGQPPYSRANPSPRYRELNALYRQMHEQGAHGSAPEQTFPGLSLPPQAGAIKQLIDRFGARTILDYGCGKGLQYQPMSLKNEATGESWPDMRHFWGVQSITCYDPAYEPFMTLPEGRFDGVICTDVLEHCPQEDMAWILEELFAYARGFVFANIACYPAKKTLPNGENAHCTIQPPQWWAGHIRELCARYPAVAAKFVVAFFEQTAEGPKPRKVTLQSDHFGA